MSTRSTHSTVRAAISNAFSLEAAPTLQTFCQKSSGRVPSAIIVQHTYVAYLLALSPRVCDDCNEEYANACPYAWRASKIRRKRCAPCEIFYLEDRLCFRSDYMRQVVVKRMKNEICVTCPQYVACLTIEVP